MEPKKRVKGKFPPGESGNPTGRPQGSRNKITLLRQSLELQLREQSQDFLPAVLKQAIELALQGDRQMIKLLLDLHMSKGQAEEQKAVEKTSIVITGMQSTEVSTAPVEADPKTKGEAIL